MTNQMPRWKKVLLPYGAWAFRVALGAIFVMASIDKILDPLTFAKSISNYHLVPAELINAMALILAHLELVCGSLLILGVFPRACLLLVNGMLLVFIVAIGSALNRQLDIGCGCFNAGDKAQAMSRWTLYWDIIWLAMGLVAFAFETKVLSVEGWIQRRRQKTPPLG